MQPMSNEELSKLGRMVQKALPGYLRPEMNDRERERVGRALLDILKEAGELVQRLMTSGQVEPVKNAAADVVPVVVGAKPLGERR